LKKKLFSLLIIGLLFFVNWGGSFLPYPSSRQVFSAEKNLLRLTLASDDKYRLWTSLKEIPSDLINAFLLKEDQSFYYHLGVNPWSILRSAFSTYILKGQKVGGSTITMQLARLHYRLHTRSIWGKIKQMSLALWLERLYSKDDILEAYLNLAPYGRNIEGVGAASRIYFQKSLNELLLPETFFLVSVPQKPGLLNKHRKFSAVPTFFESARRILAQRWKVSDLSFHQMPLHIYGISELPFEAPHWSDLLLRRRNEKNILSTLDLEKQKILEKTIERYIEKKSPIGLKNASALLLDSESMEIKAMVGSADFHNSEIAGQVNGTLAPRSPGSTLKPFIYALAIEQGLIIPQTLLFDAPLPFRTPENFDNRFLGPISAEKALVLSRNVPAVELATKLKSPNFFEFLKYIYPKRLSSKNIYGTSLALGGVEFSMLDLVELYASLANRGKWEKASFSYHNDEGFKQRTQSILRPESTAMIMDMLAKHPRPGAQYNQNYVIKDFDIFWKTGTSFGFRDAWSVGIFGKYVLAVWMGNFSGHGHPSLIGSHAAGPLFFELIDRLKSHIDVNDLPGYRYAEGVREVEVCALSGSLPQKHCPHRRISLFLPGVSSIEKCSIHRKILISRKTGKRSCHKADEMKFSKVVEVWPSHIMRIFKRLGIPRKRPPAYSKECRRSDFDSIGKGPSILIPHKGVSYTYRHNQKNSLAFKAMADSDVKKIHWYLNETYLGAKHPNKALFWSTKPGKYLVRAVDDHGRQSTRYLKVLTLNN
jgi:penicillin-binding protein 1C